MTTRVSTDMWDEIAPARSVWVITLADLALLLVGFFVLLQANRELDRETLLAGLRAGFGVEDTTPAPMAVAMARVEGFSDGSADADPRGAILWARDAARDKRTRITITGSTDGVRDVDAATGSAAILAADRARGVTAALIRSGAIDPARIVILTDPGKRRAVTLSVGFAGEAN